MFINKIFSSIFSSSSFSSRRIHCIVLRWVHLMYGFSAPERRTKFNFFNYIFITRPWHIEWQRKEVRAKEMRRRCIESNASPSISLAAETNCLTSTRPNYPPKKCSWFFFSPRLLRSSSRPLELHLHLPQKRKGDFLFMFRERCLWSVNCVMLNFSVSRVRASPSSFGRFTFSTRNAFVRCFTVHGGEAKKRENFSLNGDCYLVVQAQDECRFGCWYISKKFKESTQELASARARLKYISDSKWKIHTHLLPLAP